MTTMRSSFSLVLLVLAGVGCRGGEPGARLRGFLGGGGGPVVSDATALDCPAPGPLPFVTEATTFATVEGAETVAFNPRNKDESSDVLGNPDGLRAYTNMAIDEALAPDALVFAGEKARSPANAGLIGTGVGGEPVSLWRYDADGETWNALGRTTTDAFGAFRFELTGAFDDVTRPAYSILEGDGSCSAHYAFLLAPSTQVIITDIDGTLTLSDDELFKQIDDEAYTPVENGSASILMNTWADKGYQVVYLTARPHAFRTETRGWLGDLDYPLGPVITANELVFGDSARQYKRAWVNRVVNQLGWQVVAAYGNATSDIDAYEDAGIPKNVTFIVGENAGVAETIGIENNDYGAHITDFVQQQPDASNM